MNNTIKWILWLVAIGLLLFVGWRFVVVKEAGATAPQCISTGVQCGTDNGVQTKERESRWECPANYNDFQGKCYKWIQTGQHSGQGYFDEKPKVKVYQNCSNGYGVNPNNEGQCIKSCHTGVIQYDSCDPVGVCPTACGLEASEVPDGEGGYLKCDATPACPPAEGVCPTECGKLADYVDDGQGGQKYCPATPLCNNAASAPQCADSKPLVLPSNVHVVRAGSDATVNFFSQSNNANIYFKEVSAANWEHSARDIPVTGGYVSYTIHDLNPNLGYTFGVQSANSCAGGQTVVAVVVDDWQPRTFSLSYWEWL